MCFTGSMLKNKLHLYSILKCCLIQELSIKQINSSKSHDIRIQQNWNHLMVECKWELRKYDDGTSIIMEQKVQQWDVWIDIVSFHVVDLQRCCVNDVATTKGIEV